MKDIKKLIGELKIRIAELEKLVSDNRDIIEETKRTITHPMEYNLQLEKERGGQIIDKKRVLKLTNEGFSMQKIAWEIINILAETKWGKDFETLSGSIDNYHHNSEGIIRDARKGREINGFIRYSKTPITLKNGKKVLVSSRFTEKEFFPFTEKVFCLTY